MQEEEGELQRGGDSSSLWLILQVNLPLLWMILQVNQWRCSGSISWMWQSGLHRTQARCARISYLLTVSLFSPYQLKGKKCLLHIHLKKPSMRTLSLSLSLGSESGYKSQFWLHILKICIVSYLKFASYHILKFASYHILKICMCEGSATTHGNGSIVDQHKLQECVHWRLVANSTLGILYPNSTDAIIRDTFILTWWGIVQVCGVSSALSLHAQTHLLKPQ